VRAIRLPNGNLLIPVEADGSGTDAGLAEIGPEHPEYGKWLVVAEDGEDSRPQGGIRSREIMAAHRRPAACEKGAPMSAPVSADLTPLKIVFTNVSQTFYCLSLLAIAGIEWRFHLDLGLPPWLAVMSGYLLAGVALCLLVWNGSDGFRKLIAGRHWVPTALLTVMYLSLAILVVHAFPSIVLRK
jgi:hypothetical protein